MAVSDIVPVPGTRFEETLESASPDSLTKEACERWPSRALRSSDLAGPAGLVTSPLRWERYSPNARLEARAFAIMLNASKTFHASNLGPR